jgi:hypothetical protein
MEELAEEENDPVQKGSDLTNVELNEMSVEVEEDTYEDFVS